MAIPRILQIIIGLVGLSMVIVIHELGHLIAAKIVGVPAPLFSIGFGLPLIAITLGATTYQLALLPLGGYVAIPQEILDVQPYWIKAFILLAGVAANFIFAFCIILLFRLRHIDVHAMVYTLEAIVGPLPDTAFNIATYIFLGLFLLFLLFISFKDVRLWRR